MEISFYATDKIKKTAFYIPQLDILFLSDKVSNDEVEQYKSNALAFKADR